jgi:hypothetical protein
MAMTLQDAENEYRGIALKAWKEAFVAGQRHASEMLFHNCTCGRPHQEFCSGTCSGRREL